MKTEDKESDLWETPQWLFDKLNGEFHFDTDLCATDENKKCCGFVENLFTHKDLLREHISHSFAGWFPETGFMNPPYSRTGDFVRLAMDLVYNTPYYKTIVMLLPVDTSTKWFSLLWDRDSHRPHPGIEIRFLEGRLKFTHPRLKSTVARFPSMVVILRSK